MKLYATITSERASKSQGGKHLEATIQNEQGDILIRFEVINEGSKDRPLWNYTKVIDGDELFLINLKSNIAFYLDKVNNINGKQ
jgi:hypothetical protein